MSWPKWARPDRDAVAPAAKAEQAVRAGARPDAAGAKATLRSLQLARETLDRELEVRFNARGLVQLEGRLKADIRIVTLPEGQDPTN